MHLQKRIKSRDNHKVQFGFGFLKGRTIFFGDEFEIYVANKRKLKAEERNE